VELTGEFGEARENLIVLDVDGRKAELKWKYRIGMWLG
jgi:hypothetical protein